MVIGREGSFNSISLTSCGAISISRRGAFFLIRTPAVGGRATFLFLPKEEPLSFLLPLIFSPTLFMAPLTSLDMTKVNHNLESGKPLDFFQQAKYEALPFLI